MVLRPFTVIRWVTSEEEIGHIELKDITTYLPDDILCIFRNEHSVLLSLPTNIVSNGSIIMKELEMKPYSWCVKIRGKHVDLKMLGIDDRLMVHTQD